MFGQKIRGKGKSRSSWRWLTVLLMGLSALFVATWRVMVKRIEREGEERQPAESKPATEEKNT